MGRKKTSFGWVRDEPEDGEPEVDAAPDGESDEADEGTDRSRRRNRRVREELERVALVLARLPASARRGLSLEPDALREIDLLAESPPTPARRRQLLRVKAVLRTVDLEALEAEIAGETPRAAHLRDVERWRQRILDGGDEVIQAFVEAHPGVDRQRLRALAREARDAREVADGGSLGAARRLFVLLRDA